MKPPPRRFRGIPIGALVPNLITVMALCAGMTGIRFALQERWEFAVGAIVVAAVLDGLDGYMARRLKAQSRFGAELDSLSDFVAFGVAPALILFLWTAEDARGLGWTGALFFATCMALRLARFNTALDDPDRPAFSNRFFAGTPAPAAAMLGLLPPILSFETGPGLVSQPHAVSCWMVLVGLFMVSRTPTYSTKGARLPRAWRRPALAGAGLVIAGLLSAPWLTLAGLILLYLGSIPFSLRAHRRLAAAAAGARREAGDAGPDGGG